MIKSFSCRETKKIFTGQFSKQLPQDIQRFTARKLVMLDQSTTLDDLRIPPANRLETLSGSRAGQHSIKINKQWRICFSWHNNDAHDVEIVDYHH